MYTLRDLAAECGMTYHALYWHFKNGVIKPCQRIGNVYLFDEDAKEKVHRLAELLLEGREGRELIEALKEGDNASGS